MVPYTHINHGGSNLTRISQWTFTVLRTVGGFLMSLMMQIVTRLTVAKFNKSKALAESLEKYQATRAMPNVLQCSTIHKDCEKLAQMQLPGVPVTTAELETSRKDWMSPTYPILPVIAGQYRDTGLATRFLSNTTQPVGSGALDCVFLVLISGRLCRLFCCDVVQNANSQLGQFHPSSHT